MHNTPKQSVATHHATVKTVSRAGKFTGSGDLPSEATEPSPGNHARSGSDARKLGWRSLSKLNSGNQRLTTVDHTEHGFAGKLKAFGR